MKRFFKVLILSGVVCISLFGCNSASIINSDNTQAASSTALNGDAVLNETTEKTLTMMLPNEIELEEIGDTYQIEPIVYEVGQSGTFDEECTFEYWVETAGIVTVNEQTGLVTAVGKGYTRIYVNGVTKDNQGFSAKVPVRTCGYEYTNYLYWVKSDGSLELIE